MTVSYMFYLFYVPGMILWLRICLLRVGCIYQLRVMLIFTKILFIYTIVPLHDVYIFVHGEGLIMLS